MAVLTGVDHFLSVYFFSSVFILEDGECAEWITF